MPPRIPAPQGLRSLTLCLRPAPAPAPSLLPMVQTANISMREKKKRMKQDPYGWAQAQQRKNANLKRREELNEQRKADWGDPVHGKTTPFVESFDTAGQEPLVADGTTPAGSGNIPTSPHIINHLLTKSELEKAIDYSRRVTEPLPSAVRESSDVQLEEEDMQEHARKHAKAVAALERITALENGNAKDRKHANIRRCIETFGRHVTDHTLENPGPALARNHVPQPKPVRAGPDTGSSEVQIAILTAKIRALALALEGPKGHRDKNNKRSLRRLCHKRQRLLRYMERKERGSGRWQFLVETLGLTPATYKGQITL
ncbi:hypothetical protein VTI74DRAFT_7943 [Chaetomium olivicolor]